MKDLSLAAQRADPGPLLTIQNVSKSFSGIRALKGVQLSLRRGEVLAVIGENGAGKSTLMKILAGVLSPDAGEIRLGDELIEFNSVSAALDRGVVLIHQELNLAPNLGIGSNIFLGREFRHHGLIDQKKIERESNRCLRMVGLDLHPGRIIRSLSIGQQQLVEIAKALAVDARILIMDEPTSSLSQHEAERLFQVIGSLKERGVSIIYVSHRLSEVDRLADRVEVLRDGLNAGSLSRDEISHDRMVRLMVGRDIDQFYRTLERQTGETRLSVTGLCTRLHPDDELTFAISAGEVVGVAGLVGAGRTAVLETIFGIVPAAAGEIEVSGQKLALRGPLSAIRAGLVLVPENRKEQALILDMGVRVNLSLARLRAMRKYGFLDVTLEKGLVREAVDRFGIRCSGLEQPVRTLSGGNQQKVALVRWLLLQPKVLLLDEPTRGVDVGAKEEIYRFIEKLAGEGAAVLFVSSEMEEILGLSDRILVMHEGKITGQLTRAEASEERVMELATGKT